MRFLRTDWMRFSRLGKKRRNKQKWRRARGKHSKIRRKRFGYPVMPTVGYQTARKERNKIQGLEPIHISNAKELSKAAKHNIIILGRIGAKKKLELIKKASEMNIKIQNFGGRK